MTFSTPKSKDTFIGKKVNFSHGDKKELLSRFAIIEFKLFLGLMKGSMYKYLIIIAPILLVFFTSFAQKTLIDSLLQEAIKESSINLDSAQQIAAQAYKLSEQQDYLIGKCESRRINAMILRDRGYITKSREVIEELIITCDSLENTRVGLELEADFVALQYLNAEYDTSLESALKLIEKAKEIQDNYVIGKVYNIISCIYDGLEQTDKAINYASLSIKAAQKSKDARLYLICLHNLADLCYWQSDYDKAIESYKELLKSSKEIGNKDLEGAAYDGLGMCYLDQEEYEIAKEYLLDAQAIHLKMSDSLELAYNSKYIASIYEEQGNDEKALEYYIQAKEYIGNKGGVESQYEIVKGLIDIYTKIGDYEKASNFHTQQLVLIDTLYSFQQMEAIEELEEKYKTKELEETKLRQQYVLAIISLVLLLVVIGLSFLYYHYRQANKIHALDKRQMELEAKEKERQYKEDLEQVFEEQEKKFMDAVLRQEKINNVASQKLHDHVGNTLLSVVWSMEDYLEQQKKNQQASTFLEKTNKLLYDIYEEVRTVSHKIKDNHFKEEHLLTFDQAETIATQELVGAIEDLYDKISGDRLQAKVYVSGDVQALDSAIEIKAYRIIQELTSNVLKHAKATKVELQLNYLEDELQIILEDNGIGFQPEGKKDGIGLRNINTTIEILEGSWEIDSGKGGGTTIMIDLPANIQKVA